MEWTGLYLFASHRNDMKLTGLPLVPGALGFSKTATVPSLSEA